MKIFIQTASSSARGLTSGRDGGARALANGRAEAPPPDVGRRKRLIKALLEVAVSRAHAVRRSAEPDPSDYALADTVPDDNTQNDADNADGDDEGGEEKTEDITIESPGENFLVSLGQTVRLSCKVSSADAVIEWLKDNASYSLGTSKTGAPDTVTLENNHDLIVHDVTETDVGTYVCSLPGTSVQVVHTVRLKEPAKVVSIESAEGEILLEGMNLTLICNATGVPKPTLIWSKEISSKENMKLTPDKAQFGANSVTIQKLTRADAGTYICYATNDIGKGNAMKINIKVLGKPRVHVHRTVINSAPDIEAILECTVHEEPPALIYWYKDGKPILDNDTKYAITTIEQNSTLRVKPQTENEFGVFTCEAKNPYGTHERSIKLVQYPLIDTVEPVNGTTFRWTITSHLPLEQIELDIKERSEKNWGNVSVPIPEVHNHTYDVEYVLNRESYRPGNYSLLLRARNSAEWSQSERVRDIELESVPELIQHASVIPDGAVRPVTTVLTTLCLFLLTRIL